MVKEYLVKIKSLIDWLAYVGDHVSARDHLDAILDGLPQAYDPIISIIERKDDVTVEEAEALLIRQEIRLQCYCKQNENDVASVLITQAPVQQS